MEIPRLSNLKSDEHREYCELLARQANRDTTSVEKLFIEMDVCICFFIFYLSYSCSAPLQDNDAVLMRKIHRDNKCDGLNIAECTMNLMGSILEVKIGLVSGSNTGLTLLGPGCWSL